VDCGQRSLRSTKLQAINGPHESSDAAALGNDATDEGVLETVRDGYDAVYEALASSPTFNRIWRTNAYGGDFPEEFAHISFLTLGEAHQLLGPLAVGEGSVLVDAACGAGGPGLWVAQESRASLVGIDPAAAGVTAARRRARAVGLQDRARFIQGTFEHTGLSDTTVDAVMTVEAFQYAPDKRAALSELFRVLRPGGHLAVICFEVDPAKAEGLPVLGVDPIPDYRPLLEQLGFVVELYEETPGWQERVYGAFAAIVDARDELRAEMGERAAGAAIAEAMLTVAEKPYPARILASASRPV
jgi:SAM-dependent methyltransferase